MWLKSEGLYSSFQSAAGALEPFPFQCCYVLWTALFHLCLAWSHRNTWLPVFTPGFYPASSCDAGELKK